jgi:ceramide glucosyltransferase
VIYLLFTLAAAAAAYQLLALLACARHLRSPEPKAKVYPPISILKPVRGLDPHFYEGIRSHAVQDYPEFEILFGVSDPHDPAIEAIETLRAEFPALPVRLIVSATKAPNRKVGVLADLAREAKHSILLVNDSDIRVPPDYLVCVVAPLEDSGVGMVTCLYRAVSDSLPGRFEAVGIATDFAPSVLVAPLVGVSEFALGSTMVFRAEELARFGGFPVIADYLADDYQLSRHIRDLGLRVVMSRLVVETSLPDTSWGGVWRHQVRWARTIRVSRGDGYLGMPITHAGLWAGALAASGHWRPGLALLLLRLAAGVFAGVSVLSDRHSLRDLLFIPLRDVWAFGVWAAGLRGTSVEWRGRRLVLNREGRIVERS